MLRLARQRLGFTQKAAGERLTVPQPVLSRIENGIAVPDHPAKRINELLPWNWHSLKASPTPLKHDQPSAHDRP
ncbi:helix-turn-helix transcriptional regulator [Bradyrhizobium sp. AC87j1]|uniref:helix-turn-helix domain-containing protein n=1 Tax=Bradyrhizobium sp. AC87j1 TaxID=2055894 RepID=UPI001FE04ABC|nr:helix-turn-helix transcriptional regulator [Bradyrhizobium sp. AC87j1]